MEWLAALIRAVGASFPGAASLVQLNSEITSRQTNTRLNKLEDPISALHPDVSNISSEIYQAVKTGNDNIVKFDEEFYSRASRPLAALEAYGAIEGRHALGKQFAKGIRISSDEYMLYMAMLFENKNKISTLVEKVDTCPRGQWLDGHALAVELSLPSPLVRSIFRIFSNKGYGVLSNEIGSNKYLAKA